PDDCKCHLRWPRSSPRRGLTKPLLRPRSLDRAALRAFLPFPVKPDDFCRRDGVVALGTNGVQCLQDFRQRRKRPTYARVNFRGRKAASRELCVEQSLFAAWSSCELAHIDSGGIKDAVAESQTLINFHVGTCLSGGLPPFCLQLFAGLMMGCLPKA